MEHLNGLAPLVPAFDGYIIDLWGVVHDGVRPYPGAIDCLARLKAAGKRAVLLSNAPRRARIAQAAMRAMGIPDDLYFGILTSGEATHQMLAARSDPFIAGLGRRMFHLGPESDRNVYEGLDLEVTEDPDTADFVLNTGPDETRGLQDTAPYEALLRRMRARDLPMVCANPDFEVIRGGIPTICAGTLAQRYETLGGRVRWIGKPDPAIYEPVLALLDCPRERVLAIGDALRTDIVGAKAAGVASVWVLGGIHNHLLGDPAAAERAAAAEGLAPIATLPALRWE